MKMHHDSDTQLTHDCVFYKVVSLESKSGSQFEMLWREKQMPRRRKENTIAENTVLK